MAKYIDCDGCYHGRVCAYRHHYHDMITDCNHYTPVADVTEVKHGEWLKDYVTSSVNGHKCSMCKGLIIENMDYPSRMWLYNYCPYCGAKMDGEK